MTFLGCLKFGCLYPAKQSILSVNDMVLNTMKLLISFPKLLKKETR